MIKENKHTSHFRPKYVYDIDENSYLTPDEKAQFIIRLIEKLRKKEILIKVFLKR